MRPATSATLLVSVALAGTWFFSTPSARACSGSSPGNVTSRLVIPADGAVSVPTNAKIVVTYVSLADTHPLADHLALKTAGGVSVPVTISEPVANPSGYLIQKVFVLAPAAPLQPSTKYEVYSDIPTLPCDQNEYRMSTSSHPACAPVPGTATAISSFTTGAGPDTEPPALSGQIDYGADAQSCNASPCCGPYDGFSVAMRWPAATDGGGLVFYELSREDTVLLYPIQDGQLQISGSGVRGAFLCSGHKWISTYSTFGFEDFQGQPGNYQVVAVDLAGNRSQLVRANVTVDCSVPDGGAGAADVLPAADTLPPPADVVEPRGDAVGPSWDGPNAPADTPPGTADRYSTPDAFVPPDLSVPVDVPVPTDLAIDEVDAVDAPADAGAPDTSVVIRRDAPGYPDDTKIAQPDTAPSSPDGASSGGTEKGDGCSCRVGAGRHGFAGFALVALAMVLARRRRARRS